MTRDEGSPVDPATAVRDVPGADQPPTNPAEQVQSDLEGRRQWRAAQGVLAHMSGCTPRRAGMILLNSGERWGLESTAAVGGFFLAGVAAADADPETAAELRRMVAAAGNPGDPVSNDPNPVDPNPVDLTSVGATIASPATEGGDRSRPVAQARGLGGGLGIVFVGELDASSAPLLTSALNENAEAEGKNVPFVLDLRDLTFCDEAGLWALVEVHTRVRGSGGRLHVNPPTRLGPRLILHRGVEGRRLPPVFSRPVRRAAPVPGRDAPAAPRTWVAPQRTGSLVEHRPSSPPPPPRPPHPQGFLTEGVAAVGALIVLAPPGGQDREVAAAIAVYLARMSCAGRPRVLLVDLRWCRTPSQGRWWITQVLRHPLPAGSRVLATNAPQPRRALPEGVTVLPRGQDPVLAVRAAYRDVVRPVPA